MLFNMTMTSCLLSEIDFIYHEKPLSMYTAPWGAMQRECTMIPLERCCGVLRNMEHARRQ